MDAKMNEKLKSVSKLNEIKSNLYKRSIGMRATRYEWENPEEADGVPILARNKASQSDPNLRVSYDNFALIQNTKAGYLASNIMREYSEDINDDVKDKYKVFDRLNNTSSLWSDLMTSCAGWGNTFTICWIDEKGLIRIKEIEAWNAHIDYDDMTGEPVSGYVYSDYDSDKCEYTKLIKYTDIEKITYEKKSNEWQKVDTKKHGFLFMPLIEWVNNSQRRGNAQKAVSLLDAYDSIVSDNATEFATFRNAYLLLRDLSVSPEDKEDMQKTGILNVSDGATAEFITKEINPEFGKLNLDTIWDGIWVVSSSVDPKAVSSLSGVTAFQIAQLYRLMEMDSERTESKWLVSFEYLDRLLKSYWVSIDTPSVSDYNTYDINYIFKRALPEDVLSELEALKRAGGNLPQSYMFQRALGVSEERAIELAELASEEFDAMLPNIE